MSASVSAARRSDIAALSDVLAQAFFDDPVLCWMLPDPRTRRVRTARLFATMTRHLHLPRSGVELARDESGALMGAALWDPPGHWKAPARTQLVMLPGLLRAFGGQLGRAGQASDRMRRAHPTDRHWYLAVVGTAPAARGLGFGHALLRSRLARCDAQRVPAYLESSKPENIPYYERYGFVVTGEIALADGGPVVWPMWRMPG